MKVGCRAHVSSGRAGCTFRLTMPISAEDGAAVYRTGGQDRESAPGRRRLAIDTRQNCAAIDSMFCHDYELAYSSTLYGFRKRETNPLRFQKQNVHNSAFAAFISSGGLNRRNDP